MVLIMVTTWYPPDKAIEVAKKFVEVMQKFPLKPFEKELVPAGGWGVSAVKDGIRAVSITEVETGKYEETLNVIARRFVEFFGIEGYRYEIETLMTVEEAMPMIGLAPP